MSRVIELTHLVAQVLCGQLVSRTVKVDRSATKMRDAELAAFREARETGRQFRFVLQEHIQF